MATYPAYTGDEPCRQVDPEWFYPVTFNGVTRKDRAMLNDLCNGCSMREPCLSWALAHEKEGFWAGTTPEDRIKLRRKMSIALDSRRVL